MLFESGLGVIVNVYCKLRQSLKKKGKSITNILTKGKKQNNIKCFIKTAKNRKRVEDRNNKGIREQVENSNKCGRY